MASNNGSLRVLLLGKTGSGKSSLGNMLLGRDAFGVRRGMSSGTDKCNWEEAETPSFRLEITDTPGLCDTHRAEESIICEMAKSIGTCAPGPHIVLVVCRCDRRFDRAEYDAYVALKKLFGEEICRYMIVVFAGADAIAKSLDEQQIALEKELAGNPSQIKNVLEDAKQRFYAVSNSAETTPQGKTHQAQSLYNLMWRLHNENRGGFFTSRVCEEMERQVDALVTQRMRRDRVTQDEAKRRIRLGIVEETLGHEFVDTILRLVETGLPPNHSIQIAQMCHQM